MRAFEPGHIGYLEIKNRIALAPMTTNLANLDGTTNDVHVRYLEERARGGAGLIITEYAYIDQANARGSRNELGAYSSLMAPKLRRIPDTIHPYGASVFIQLVHCGGKALWEGNKEQPMAPSSVSYRGRMPREMTLDDIENTIKSFEKAAKVAKLSGFDGIEIHGAHAYLVHEFLSPVLNVRQDKYGGTFEKRLTFPQEVIDAVRGAVDIPVGIRLSLYEDEKDGWDPEYGLRIAESLKNIDYVHLSAGGLAPPGSTASFYTPDTPILTRLPRKPNKTTMLVGSVVNIEGVERVLSVCDFVSVGRAMLADAYFPDKIRNFPKLLRPCIRCNQGCNNLSHGEVRCTVNPDVGFEETYRPQFKGEVAIRGGGVQGMEASLYAAKLGLKVTLYEKEEILGGQLNRIYDPYKKKEFLKLLDYYAYALKRAGVDIVTSTKYNGKSVDCLPPIFYPDPPKEASSFKSNIHADHDFFLRLAENKKIEVSMRSLDNIDSGRRIEYIAYAKSKGIKFSDIGNYDYVMVVENQYDLDKAIALGRGKIKSFLAQNSNSFL